ncbi:periodic tryptophan protein 2-like protein [Pyrus ussuriensis x Pyrus communis]|uniref:Periodic tryptophan protein 2-like protein n=1 Tax=Pyrus ussuriensis x Pyrus communis TaxID=2448454 RepID=A0A5N5H7F4_9ROSA|nr:periodic tryptophan protein 2-like protein [Pyrus ussuriensis x Pyrus communis]
MKIYNTGPKLTVKKLNYRFQNLLGAPYRGGNAEITNNTELISPVGNRVSVTDLIKSQTTTLPFQSSSNISRIAASPDGVFLLTVDDNRRCLFINLRQRVVLHRISFKNPVNALEFSPNGTFIAVATGESDGTEVKEPASPGTPIRDGDDEVEGIGSGNVKKRKGYEGREGDLDEEGGGLHMLVVGFSNGVFGLYQMPDFVCLHLLSISREKITMAVFNELGNWLTFGCAKLGRLLVWEWKSESYILKQQGHYFDVNCLAYSPDSQLLATGADDNKVKVWTVSSGFCFITFSEHANAITALLFMANSHSLLSASLDGTVRAWDLYRYRNFRTFTTPETRQFVSLAADQSGEVICAGTLDSFEIFVWSMKTSRLLDILSGHEGPVHGLMFSPTNATLASSSWDRTVRLWDVFDGKGVVETFTHTHDVLTLVYRPDGKQLASSTLDGQIHFWDPIDGLLMYTIEGCRDISGGRLMTDRRAAANSSSGKFFTTLCYSADGTYILAGGSSKYICMYDVADQVLLRRFQITHNVSLDGVLDFLNSKNMTDAGPLDLIDDDNSDIEEGVDKQTRGKLGYDLPGSMPNHGRPVVRTKCLRIAPTGRSFSAATTEGVLVYSIDDSFIFDPTDLDIDVTPEAVDAALNEDKLSKALILSLRLNKDSLSKKCIFKVSPIDIPAVISSIPYRYLQRLIEVFADLLESRPHLEFGTFIDFRFYRVQMLSSAKFMVTLQKAITRTHQYLKETCSSNECMLRYLCSASSGK